MDLSPSLRSDRRSLHRIPEEEAWEEDSYENDSGGSGSDDDDDDEAVWVDPWDTRRRRRRPSSRHSPHTVAWLAILRHGTLLVDIGEENEEAAEAAAGLLELDGSTDTATSVADEEEPVHENRGSGNHHHQQQCDHGWKAYSAPSSPYRGIRFRVDESASVDSSSSSLDACHYSNNSKHSKHKSEKNLVWTFLCVYHTRRGWSTTTTTGPNNNDHGNDHHDTMVDDTQARAFVLSKLVTATETLRAVDHSWRNGGYHACQYLFAPVLQHSLEHATTIATHHKTTTTTTTTFGTTAPVTTRPRRRSPSKRNSRRRSSTLTVSSRRGTPLTISVSQGTSRATTQRLDGQDDKDDDDDSSVDDDSLNDFAALSSPWSQYNNDATKDPGNSARMSFGSHLSLSPREDDTEDVTDDSDSLREEGHYYDYEEEEDSDDSTTVSLGVVDDHSTDTFESHDHDDSIQANDAFDIDHDVNDDHHLPVVAARSGPVSSSTVNTATEVYGSPMRHTTRDTPWSDDDSSAWEALTPPTTDSPRRSSSSSSAPHTTTVYVDMYDDDDEATLTKAQYSLFAEDADQTRLSLSHSKDDSETADETFSGQSTVMVEEITAIPVTHSSAPETAKDETTIPSADAISSQSDGSRSAHPSSPETVEEPTVPSAHPTSPETANDETCISSAGLTSPATADETTSARSTSSDETTIPETVGESSCLSAYSSFPRAVDKTIANPPKVTECTTRQVVASETEPTPTTSIQQIDAVLFAPIPDILLDDEFLADDLERAWSASSPHPLSVSPNSEPLPPPPPPRDDGRSCFLCALFPPKQSAFL